MIVRFKEATDYKPTLNDSRRCWGQLRYRLPKSPAPELVDGEFQMPPAEPMVSYFPKGATPELADDIAMGFVDADVAERFQGEPIEVVSTARILDGMPEK